MAQASLSSSFFVFDVLLRAVELGFSCRGLGRVSQVLDAYRGEALAGDIYACTLRQGSATAKMPSVLQAASAIF